MQLKRRGELSAPSILGVRSRAPTTWVSEVSVSGMSSYVMKIRIQIAPSSRVIYTKKKEALRGHPFNYWYFRVQNTEEEHYVDIVTR